jgi:hypothetical protein
MVAMLTFSMSGILESLAVPFAAIGGNLILCKFLEKKGREGTAVFVNLAVLALLFLFWLLPLIDRLFWLFTGALSLPLGLN